MNTKRQTIWLVSMLSLMVVLSAYYLFTEDVSNLQFTTKDTTSKIAAGAEGKQGAAGSNIVGGTTGTTGAAGTGAAGTNGTTGTSAKEIIINTNDLNVKPVTPEAKPAETKSTASSTPAADTKGGAAQTETKQPAAGTASPTAKSNAGVSQSDAKVLQQVMTQAKSGSDYFTNLGLKRNEDIAKLTEKWMTIIADPKQSPEAAANAEAELRKIQDNEAKVTNLEDLLMKDFPQAVITEDSSKWRITVQSNKLERSQATGIIDNVMKELNVGADKIVVQFVP